MIKGLIEELMEQKANPYQTLVVLSVMQNDISAAKNFLECYEEYLNDLPR